MRNLRIAALITLALSTAVLACSATAQDLGGNDPKTDASTDDASIATDAAATSDAPLDKDTGTIAKADASTTDGGNAGADGGSIIIAPSGTKRVFVTAGVYSANLLVEGSGATGPEGADKLCNKEAQTAGIGGTWKAWIKEVGFGSGALRVGTHGPWARMDHALVFSGASVTGFPLVPINQTPLGTEILASANYYVFTSIADDGTVKGPDLDCQAWTSSSSGYDLSVGNCTKTNNWSSTGTVYCSRSAHLYCFEQ